MAEAATVLVVEGDVETSYLQPCLQRAGYHVLRTTTAAAGLATALHEPIDLIVMDEPLSGNVRGLEWYGKVKAAGHHVPAILVIAHLGEKFLLEAMRAGIKDVITRTTTCAELLLPSCERVLREHRTEIQRAGCAPQDRPSPETDTRQEKEPVESRLQQADTLQRQAHLLELAHALVRDEQGKIVFWNQGTMQLYGWTEEEALGRTVDELLQTIYPVTPEQIDEELRRRGQWQGELIHTRKDGSTIVVTSHRAMHCNDAGQPVAILEINNDITDVKRLQESLKEADRRKDEFLATLAHELRNPLAPIRNALHLMRLMKNHPATVEQSREMMERQVKHMVRLIDDLLELSRLSRGKVQIKKEMVEARTIIDMAVEGSRPWLDAAGHQFVINVPDEPLWLEADPLRLTQVLLNLLNNAAKYTEPGGTICLSAEEFHAGGHAAEAVFRVRDTGIGIPAEMLPRIFEMFTQVNRALDRTQGGLGIGLSLVRGLVQLHDGRVEAHSAGPGQGSEFVVRLPLPQARENHNGSLESAGAEGEAVSVPLRILVIDDNKDAAESLALLLQTLGHEVHEAYDGLSALDATQRLRPQIVFCDIGLPGLNGYEVARRLRAQPQFQQTLLVALTGWGQEEDRRRSQEAGFDAHLVKPIEQEALIDILLSVGSSL
jgi:PAS domain S-box-containing protein